MAVDLSGDELVAAADRIAETAHEGQTDKAGLAYIEHPRRVASRLTDPEAKAAALLHDVLEDCDVSADDLRSHGVPQGVIDCVDLLTRREGVSNDVYYERIRSDERALSVKLADMADNTDPERLRLLPAETQDKLRRKYRGAYNSLGRTDLAEKL